MRDLTPELKEAFEKILSEPATGSREETILQVMHAAYTLGRDAEKWISVQERLPDLQGRYNVYIPQIDMVETIAYIFVGSKWSWQSYDLSITHWQPLPSPLR